MVKILIVLAVVVLATGVLLNNKDEGGEVVQETFPVSEKGEDNEENIDSERITEVENETLVSSNEVINLSGQGLGRVPSYVFDAMSIQELDLSNNQLGGSLQAEVRHLQNLRVLNLSNNQFTGVPAEVGQLKKLEVLDLSNNQLIGLPYELGNLSNLKVLNLKGNAYASADLSIIKQKLPVTTMVLVD